MRILLFILFFVAIALLWKVTPLADYATPDYIVPLLDKIHDSPWAVPAAFGIYLGGTLLFVPHMVMTLAMMIAFPPLESIPIVLGGSLASAAIGYGIGRKLGLNALRFLTGGIAEKICYYAKNGGILGLTLLRMIPTGPFALVNIVLGMSQAPFITYMLATLLGLMPGTFVGAMLGSSVLDVWESPDHKSLIRIGLGLTGWAVIVAMSFVMSRSKYNKPAAM